ncbi:hypothetical protein BC829DRAFT_70005 [Chytridium lagenaria]|nr:hypothetical protein BC829DRAFT_70005 [Chytridium lagenaria]
MTLDSPSDPLKSMKLVKTGVPYETKLVGEAIKKRCHKFEFQGVTYQWDGAGLGNNLTCKISGTNNLVALIRRHPTTFLSGGVIEIQPGGQICSTNSSLLRLRLKSGKTTTQCSVIDKRRTPPSIDGFHILFLSLSTYLVILKQSLEKDAHLLNPHFHSFFGVLCFVCPALTIYFVMVLP